MKALTFNEIKEIIDKCPWHFLKAEVLKAIKSKFDEPEFGQVINEDISINKILGNE